ncbi:MAG: hypothetical protein QNJ27_05170 [Simkaniaceae bacterium]|nr:hypothetical protein [Simkaniaceae bacterium]
MQPQTEEVALSLECAISPIIATIKGYLTPPVFSLDSVIPPLLEEDSLAQKRSPFSAKKNSNFSREIIKDKKEGLSPFLFVADSNKSLLAIDPNLEQRKVAKQDFLSKKISLDLENHSSNRSSPQSFEHFSNHKFSLIHRAFAHKKTKPIMNSSLKELKNVPHGKKKYFTEGYFRSLKWADVSKITHQKNPIVLSPSLEVIEELFHPYKIKLSLEASTINASLFDFKEVSIAFDLRYKPYRQEKIALELSSLDCKAFKATSYLHIKPIEARFASTPRYPSPEKAYYLVPSKCSLPQGPTIATKRNQRVIPFTQIPEFDLYCSKKTLDLPKKAHAFQASALARMSSYLYREPHKEMGARSCTPSSRIQSPLAVSEANERFISDVIVQNDYKPSKQKREKSLSKTLPSFSIPELQYALFALETQKNISIPMQDAEILFEKFAPRETTNMQPYDFSLSQAKRKEVSPKTGTRIPSKLVEDILRIQSMAILIKWTDRDSTIKSSSFHPSSENFSCEKMRRPLLHPLYPTYCPPKISGLDSGAITHSVSKKHLEYLKKKFILCKKSPEDLMLPLSAARKVFPNKAVTAPQRVFTDLPEANKVVCVVNYDKQFPSTREIFKGYPVPVRIQAEITFSDKEPFPLKTGMIRSQSKKILENYHKETLVASAAIALVNPELESSLSDSEKRSLNQSSRFTNAFLTEIPPPSHLETVSYHNEFETSVHYSKKEEGRGYLFSIQIKPSQNLHFASPNQHYIFVVDRSSSIKKHRFEVFKEGVGRALSYLEKGDSFNIVIADTEMIPLSETPTPWSKGSVSKARGFLTNQNYRGFFIHYNAFELLANVSNYFAPDKENIVVLLTDGHAFKSFQDHKNDFKKLSQESKGKFSIFTATASQGNNLLMLDLLSTFNSGELVYSKTNASFSRQLSVLIKRIESFIAKDIHINVTSITNETKIAFYPNEKLLLSLYANRPYTVYGCIDELKDFALILQGRCGDKWINIKQTISFKHPKQATHSIKKRMAMQKAYAYYDLFLKNEDPSLLKKAQSILKPLHTSPAVR